jgi:hypothetical protein
MTVVQEEVKTYGQYMSQSFGPAACDDDVHTTVLGPGIVDSPVIAPHAWSTSFAQARSEAIRQQAEKEWFIWMIEADQHMFQLGLEPVPWEQFEEAVSQKDERQFLAMEQRASEEQAMHSPEQPAPDSLVGATIVIRSETVISALRMVSHAIQAENATTAMLSTVVKALPQGGLWI